MGYSCQFYDLQFTCDFCKQTECTANGWANGDQHLKWIVGVQRYLSTRQVIGSVILKEGNTSRGLPVEWTC